MDKSKIKARTKNGLEKAQHLGFSRHNFPGGMMAFFIIGALALGVLLSEALTLVSVSEDFRDLPGNNSAEVKLSNSALPVLSAYNIGEEIQSIVNNGRTGTTAPFNVSACLQSINISENALAVEQIQWQEKGPNAWLILHSTRNLADIRSSGGSINAVVVSPNCPESSTSPSKIPVNLWSGTALVAPVGQSEATK